MSNILPFGVNYQSQGERFTFFTESDWDSSDDESDIQHLTVNMSKTLTLKLNHNDDEDNALTSDELDFIHNCVRVLSKKINDDLYNENVHHIANLNAQNNDMQYNFPEINPDVKDCSIFTMYYSDGVLFSTRLKRLAIFIKEHSSKSHEKVLELLLKNDDFNVIKTTIRSCYCNGLHNPYNVQQLYIEPMIELMLKQVFINYFL